VPNTAIDGNAFSGDRPLSAGAITFAPDGTLFLGDSKAGAIWAYPSDAAEKVADVAPFLFAEIDQRMADVLGVTQRQLAYNGIAVHPITRETYISLGIKNNGSVEPAVVRVSHDGAIAPFDLNAKGAT
jgi:hypothetical protein